MLAWFVGATVLLNTGLLFWNWTLRRYAVASGNWIQDEVIPYLELDHMRVYEANELRINAVPEIEDAEANTIRHVVPATLIWSVTLMLLFVALAGIIEPFVSVIGMAGTAYMITTGLTQHAWYLRIHAHVHQAQTLLDAKAHHDDEIEGNARHYYDDE